jgi:phage N-6-adenine-methyltransferase
LDIPRKRKGGSATPHSLFNLLNTRVEELTGQPFRLDAAAEKWNAKCDHYFDEEADSLKQDWSQWPTIFCNPPYSAQLLAKFVAKALEAASAGSTVVLLLPSWPGYPWFQELKRRCQMQDIIGPVAFERADGSKAVLNNGYQTYSLVVATLGPGIAPGTNGEPIRGVHRPLAAPQTRRLLNAPRPGVPSHRRLHHERR